MKPISTEPLMRRITITFWSIMYLIAGVCLIWGLQQNPVDPGFQSATGFFTGMCFGMIILALVTPTHKEFHETAVARGYTKTPTQQQDLFS